MRSSVLAPWLVGALTIGVSLSISSAVYAQDEGAPPSEGEGDAAKPAEGGDADTAGAPKKEDEEKLGGWGVGGKEGDGNFKPHGKTGKLKELEDDQEERRIVDATPANLGRPGNSWVDVVIAPGGSIIVPIQVGGPTEVAPGASFVLGTTYRAWDKWEFGIRFGVSSSATNGPRQALLVGSRDPDSFKQIATGNLEVSLRPFFKLTPSTVVPVGLALVLPTAMGDMFADPDSRVELARWNVNQSASAMRGWEDKALFEPHRFAIVPSVGAIYQRPMGSGVAAGTLVLEGRTKLEIMALTGGKDPSIDPSAQNVQGDVKDVAVNWLLGGSAGFAMLDGLVTPSLKAWFVYASPTSTFGSIEASGAQLVVEPGVATSVPFGASGNLRFQGRLSGILPLGGPLGSGNQATPAGIAGLRVAAGLSF